MAQKKTEAKLKAPFATGEIVVPECEMTYEGGDDIAKKHGDCGKNPGHTTFIPVPDLQLSDLPVEHRSPGVLQTVKVICDLTVKILVKFISVNRPDKYADCDEDYPYSKQKGSKRIRRYGTGFVRILAIDEKECHIQGKPCPCHECQRADSPKNEYWTLLVSTAAHVIFDNSEAERSTFECFFDTEDRKNVKMLYGVSLKSQRLDFNKYQSDLCYVHCVTHDRELLLKLLQLSTLYNFTFNMGTEKEPKESILAYLVSHPHGCSKRVTFGTINHFTIPVDEEYPVDKRIMFERDTVCRLPLFPWSTRSHRMSKFIAKTKSGSSPLGTEYCLSLDNREEMNEKHSFRDIQDCKSEKHSNPIAPGGLDSAKAAMNNMVKRGSHLRESTSDVLHSDEDLISLMSSLPHLSGDNVTNDTKSDSVSEANTAGLQFEEGLNQAECKSSKVKDFSGEGAPVGISWGIGDDFPGLKDATIVLSPELEYAAGLHNFPTDVKPEPGSEFYLPFGTYFTLPNDAKFALRFASLQPGWFTLPVGTKYTLPNDKSFPLPPEAEFLSRGLRIRFAYITYDIDSCPGSSGALVHQHGDGMGIPMCIFHFSHFGAVMSTGKNRSGLQNLGFAGM